MRYYLSGLLCTFWIAVHADDSSPYRTNLWGSTQFNYRISPRWEWQTDVGYRRCDRFIREQRQLLVRSALLYRFSEKVNAGAGFAWFGHHTTGNLVQEYRPFLQLNLRTCSKSWTHTMRIRNEWRWYPQRSSWSNRTRLQVGARFNRFKRIQPYATLEGFVTPGTKTLLESRVTAGIVIPLGKSTVSVFYTFQHQSTIAYGQHIIGIQYTFTAN